MSINMYENNINTHLKDILLQIYSKTYDFVNLGVIFTAMFVFLKFKTFDIKNIKITKIINFVSVSVFSIYLIHENTNNRWLWGKLFNPLQYSHSIGLVGYIIAIALLVFIVCLFIDFMRRGLCVLLKKIPFITKIITKLDEKLGKINTKVNSYLS